jgi:hypothetical protein
MISPGFRNFTQGAESGSKTHQSPRKQLVIADLDKIVD